jgi:hypothetical protein
MWKRWLLFTFQVAAVAATAALGLYQYLVPPSAMKWRVELAFLAAIFLFTALGAYYTYVSPARELKAFVIAVLEAQAQHIVDFAKSQGIDIRLNIAVVSFYPLQWAYPPKRFKIVWDCGMKYAPDAFTTFPVSKGVAGEAYRRRRDRLVNMEIAENQKLEKWGFSKKEASCFPKFTAVWSLPVFRLGAGDRPTGKICGMLNLDSTSTGAFAVLTTHLEIGTLLGEMRELLCKLNL